MMVLMAVIVINKINMVLGKKEKKKKKKSQILLPNWLPDNETVIPQGLCVDELREVAPYPSIKNLQKGAVSESC
ncbi:unnamed protein product, partial [Vitis vinifera]